MKKSFWLNVMVVFALLLSLVSPAAHAYSEGTEEGTSKVLLKEAVPSEDGNVLVWETHSENPSSGSDEHSFMVVKNGDAVEVAPEELLDQATEFTKVYTYTDKVDNPTAIEYGVIWNTNGQALESNKMVVDLVETTTTTEEPSSTDTVVEEEEESNTEIGENETVPNEEESVPSEEPAPSTEEVENTESTQEEVDGSEVNFVPSEKENLLKNSLIGDEEESYLFLDKMFVNEHSFAVMWFGHVDRSLGRIAKYELYLNDTLISSGGPRLSDYEFTNLTPDTLYEVKVKALDKNGKLLLEETLEVNTLPAPSGEVVKFEDANLALAIQTQMNLDREIRESDMEHLTMLDASSLGLTSIKGLEKAVNLEILFLYDNSIEDLSPLAGLTKLFMLDVEENNITNVNPLSNLTNLYILGLGNNPITKIDALAGLTNLEGLFLHSTQISDISPLANLINLTFVTVADTNVDFTTESSAWDLLNAWADAGVYVDVLEEDYFEPFELEFYNTTEQSISLGWWYYTDNDEDYEKEYLYKVYVNDVLYEETNMTELTILGLEPSKDYIIKVEMYDEDGTTLLYENYDMAQTLALPTGEIVKIPDSGLNEAVRYQLGLHELDREIYQSDMERLEYLFASWMGIKKLDGIEHAVNLLDLDISANEIKDLSPLKGMESLYSLTLSDNLITDISALKDLYISYLDLSENPISDISGLSRLSDLENLYLHHTNITDISVLLELDYLWEVTLFGIEGLTFEEGSPELAIVEQLRELGVTVYLTEDEFHGPSPYTLEVIDVTDSTIEVEWTYEWADEVDHYQVLLDGEVVDITNDTFYLFTDLMSDTLYNIAIIPVDVDGWEMDYFEIDASTLPAEEQPVDEEEDNEEKEEDKTPPVVVKPGDKDKQPTVEKPSKETNKGNKLPVTATNTLNFILIGLVMLVVGAAGFWLARRRVAA
ncbi:leucine-rich repeat domain-containing protein [Sutcliffiella horikoshii]|uniref:LPXTG cell wall anchor domain-containing protein n=1 Tax=Sutcliffiella horikoshii TaxID=79883 RepID=A0A5D4TB40_9BACI|nr:leucine-rich repeat domain-containing protein [Sutcliffiella horikoshii]TYS72435.1 LPXTG cell wall anchor domain-containing protein [Sutcliffiella horikoshii]